MSSLGCVGLVVLLITLGCKRGGQHVERQTKEQSKMHDQDAVTNDSTALTPQKTFRLLISSMRSGEEANLKMYVTEEILRAIASPYGTGTERTTVFKRVGEAWRELAVPWTNGTGDKAVALIGASSKASRLTFSRSSSGWKLTK